MRFTADPPPDRQALVEAARRLFGDEGYAALALMMDGEERVIEALGRLVLEFHGNFWKPSPTVAGRDWRTWAATGTDVISFPMVVQSK